MPNPLSIVAYPTVSGMQRALNLNAGMALQVKYIAVGSGLQTLQFDDGGRAMTDTLANLIGYVEVATAEKVSPYQWQMTVNLAGLIPNEWRLSEFALCDADHNVIAIYGSATQAIYPVTPYVTDALLSVNLLLAAFPANSVVIEHHNQPLDLFGLQRYTASDPLPTVNRGVIWHDAYADLMTWRTIGAYSGYASVRLGQVVYVESSQAPQGYLKSNGASLPASYAALMAYLGRHTLLDLRGEFVRGWDDGRGIDASRSIGSFQGSTEIPYNNMSPSGYSGSRSLCDYIQPLNSDGLTNQGGLSTWGVLTIASGSALDAIVQRTRVRPRNIALLACVKF